MYRVENYTIYIVWKYNLYNKDTWLSTLQVSFLFCKFLLWQQNKSFTKTTSIQGVLLTYADFLGCITYILAGLGYGYYMLWLCEG